MAGDWMKMVKTTPDKPEVYAIADQLNIDPDAVFGKLFRVWSWFDDHTENGNAPSVTKKLLDRITGVTGFADAMITAGWMNEESNAIQLPNFERHNGETSKKRALTAKRVSRVRNKSNDNSVTDVTHDALAREEKRREEKSKDQETKDYCLELENVTQQALQPPPVITIPLVDKSEFPITQKMIDEWIELFPGIDVMQELRNCRSWNLTNPRNRKTKTGVLRHVNQWLTREQNSARKTPNSNTEDVITQFVKGGKSHG